MMSSSGNPYMFPGLPGADNQANPLMQSLEMMRQAWSTLNPAAMQPNLQPQALLDPGDIDRRIAELQAVENWLNLNLNMVQTSVRALEVQRATLSTLRSFAGMGGQFATPPSTSPSGPSPLEVALGLKPASSPATPAPAEPEAAPTHSAPAAAAQPAAGAAESATEGSATTPAGAVFSDPAQAAAAQQAWWNMLQQQFNQVASAAAATFTGNPTAAEGDEAKATTAPAAASGTARAAAGRKTAGKTTSARKTPSKASTKAASKNAKRKT